MSAQPSFNLPMINVDGFVFNAQSIIAIDLTAYQVQDPDRPTTTAGDRLHEGRKITLHLVGPTLYVFTGERADKAWHWYLQLRGQATHLVNGVERVFWDYEDV